MGGAITVLSGRRLVAVGGLLAALVLYGAVANAARAALGTGRRVPQRPRLPRLRGRDLARAPACQGRAPYLIVAAAVAGVAALGFTTLEVGSAANVAKLACYALVGFWFLTLFEELWWVTLIAVVVPWADIWSVAAGPTRYVVEEQPGIFERLAVAFPSPGETATVNIGPPDILFFALLLGAADRFRLRVAWTWVAMTALLSVTLALVWTWDDAPGLPALPAICLGFLLPNADFLWRDARAAWVARADPTE